MTDLSSKWLVETDWLHERLSSPGLVIIDASWTMPGEPRTGGELYREAHIPGALFFDIDEIADTSSSLPHMLPAPEKFCLAHAQNGRGRRDEDRGLRQQGPVQRAARMVELPGDGP